MAEGSRINYKLQNWGNTRSVQLRNFGPVDVTYVYNTTQAADFCECTEQTVRRWVKTGLLPAFKTVVNDDSVPPESNRAGTLLFLKQDLINALRVGLGVPTEGFNVEDNPRNRDIH